MWKKVLKALKVKKATGVDFIPSRLLKVGANIVAPPLGNIFNMTIQNCKIPMEWKTARIIPIYKSGLKTDPRNYRPITPIYRYWHLFKKF